MRTLALLPLIACNGVPDTACTDIGCADGLDVQITHAAWAQGSYRFEIVLPSGTVTCTATIPLPDQADCDGNGVLLTLSGSMLPVDEQSIPGLHIEAADFDELTLRIYLDDALQLEQTLTPVWELSQPNGPDCPPTCLNDQVTVSF